MTSICWSSSGQDRKVDPQRRNVGEVDIRINKTTCVKSTTKFLVGFSLIFELRNAALRLGKWALYGGTLRSTFRIRSEHVNSFVPFWESI
jgi:hypothetical protein